MVGHAFEARHGRLDRCASGDIGLRGRPGIPFKIEKS